MPYCVETHLFGRVDAAACRVEVAALSDDSREASDGRASRMRWAHVASRRRRKLLW